MPLKSPSEVKGAVRRNDTILRLGGHGDDFHMSWAADDRLLVALCDGTGWPNGGEKLHNDNSRLWAILGGPHEARFEEVAGYPELIQDFESVRCSTRYFGFGTLALDGCIYQFLSTPDRPFLDRPSMEPHPRFVGAKLIYSPDNGSTWCNQDGSTPVVWEEWEDRSKDNMMFFREPQDAFSQLSVLQMGKNYDANTDGFVYVYGPNGNTDGTMNELVMFRVPQQSILDRSAYEYFGGLGADGSANWVKDIMRRRPVHTFPRGWVNKTLHPWSWLPSLAYNAPLGVYMMASAGTGCSPDGNWFGKPSYLGLWVAQHPWGPWTQIHEETAWTPDNDRDARAYSPQIAPKWIAKDGKSFWLVWSDFQSVEGGENNAVADLERIRQEHPEIPEERLKELAAIRPYYAFNAQRVDLGMA
jgi:hypothetical protein